MKTLFVLAVLALSGCATMDTNCNSSIRFGDITKKLETPDFRVDCRARR
ncbi:Uncharacterised protein [Moraxella caviae]|uniref:Lipoprotein n=1 Tax=Moraxella caviae TaxID=34060 RepID=A0A378R6C3_9GAMM|nr:hypothetical protein [Moraxella caviae]STZ13606.1 Uncharacterised protein [Moraxella caviae]VEW13304.1 Uncharacterised protein [Moraxella caviae]